MQEKQMKYRLAFPAIIVVESDENPTLAELQYRLERLVNSTPELEYAMPVTVEQPTIITWRQRLEV